MIQINFVQPASLLLNDLHHHVVFGQFIEEVLKAAGWELRWEHFGEYRHSDEGFISYTDLGRRLIEAVDISERAHSPTEQERMA